MLEDDALDGVKDGKEAEIVFKKALLFIIIPSHAFSCSWTLRESLKTILNTLCP